MHGPDGLGEVKAPDIPFIVHSEVDTWRAGRLNMQQQCRCVESVASMIERVSEEDRHYGASSSSKLWDLNPQNVPYPLP